MTTLHFHIEILNLLIHNYASVMCLAPAGHSDAYYPMVTKMIVSYIPVLY